MRFKKFLMLSVVGILATSVMTVCASSDELNASAEILAMSAEETAARGFLIINEDVCDLNGNILIDLTNGLTPDGYELDPEFRVTYPGTVRTNDLSLATVGTSIINGTKFVNQNVDGFQWTIFGNIFHLTSICPNVYVKYVSGAPIINVSIYNNGRGTVVNLCPGLKSVDAITLIGYATNDDCVLKANAEDLSASVRLMAYTIE